MAFGDRPAELRKRLTEARPRLTEDEAKRIEDVLKNYESARNDALNAASDVLRDTGDDPKQSDYNDKLRSGKARVSQILAGMLDGINGPSPDAVLFRTQTLLEDAGFFGSLDALDLGEARDALLRFKVRLRDMMVTLEATWDTTSREDQRIEELEKRAAEDMNQALKKGIEDGVAAYAQLGQYTYRAAEWVKGIPDWVNKVVVESVRAVAKAAQDWGYVGELDRGPDLSAYADLIPKMSDAGKELFERAKAQGIDAKVLAKMVPYLVQNPGMDFSDKIDDALKALGERIFGAEAGGAVPMILKMLGECKKFTWVLGEPYINARRAYLDQLPNEGTILICFSKSRQDVDKFIQDNGIDAAQKYFDTIKDDLNPWMSALPGEGLQSDAHNFGTLTLDGFSRRMSDLQSTFSDFVSRYRGRFIGEVDQNTQRLLIDIDNWKSKAEGMANLGLDQRLREWRSSALAVGPGFDDAFSQVQGKVASLPIAFQTAVRDRLNSQYQELKSQLAQAQQEAAASLDQPEKTVSSDEIRKVFDRSALQQALR